MKVNFKRMITVLAATAMCAVPMTSAMSASAEEMVMMSGSRKQAATEMKRADTSLKLADGGTLLASASITDQFSGIRAGFDPDHGCGNEPKVIDFDDDDDIIIIVIGPRGPRPWNPHGPCGPDPIYRTGLY